MLVFVGGGLVGLFVVCVWPPAAGVPRHPATRAPAAAAASAAPAVRDTLDGGHLPRGPAAWVAELPSLRRRAAAAGKRARVREVVGRVLAAFPAHPTLATAWLRQLVLLDLIEPAVADAVHGLVAAAERPEASEALVAAAARTLVALWRAQRDRGARTAVSITASAWVNRHNPSRAKRLAAILWLEEEVDRACWPTGVRR